MVAAIPIRAGGEWSHFTRNGAVHAEMAAGEPVPSFMLDRGLATASSHRSALHDRGGCVPQPAVARFRQFRVIVQIGSVHGHPFQSTDFFRFGPAKLFRFLPAQFRDMAFI